MTLLPDENKRYFTGKPCKNGHISERLISNRACIECSRIKKLDWAYNNQENINEKSRLKRMENPEASRIYDYARYHDDPSFKMLAAAKQRAKIKNLEFNIDISDIIIPKMCPLLYIPLTINNNTISDNSPSLDRVNNKFGYVKGNVIVISYLANRCKGKLNADEILKIGTNLKIIEDRMKGFI